MEQLKTFLHSFSLKSDSTKFASISSVFLILYFFIFSQTQKTNKNYVHNFPDLLMIHILLEYVLISPKNFTGLVYDSLFNWVLTLDSLCGLVV